jgi:D-alanyl-lipoteichoic acid acyltransferase DltB (MBOAT superfamily)
VLFSSWTFIVYFLPATLVVFTLIPSRWEIARKTWLIAASFVFYGYWKLEYVPLLIGSILVNYACAEGMVRFAPARWPRLLLIAGVSLNLLLLAYFKYTNFAVNFFGWIAQKDLGQFNIILPLAISFFTFTQISYLVDVYRDRTVHTRFLDYSLFVVLFPHLIAGPIVRHWEIIPQFSTRDFRFTRDNFGVGMTLFLFGLIKKYLADSAALYADDVYNGAAQGATLSTFDSWIGTFAFALQIYFDFSSYSDMAIGLARMLGIKFPFNFDSPYRASSIIVFWERWHRTLTRFLREYVYYSLGGNRCGQARQTLNIMATMLLSGLWHGAGWTFIVWGALHGCAIVINHQWRRLLVRWKWNLDHGIYRAVGVLLTFIVVSLAWTFFRAPTLGVAGKMLASLLALDGFSLPDQWFAHGPLRDHFLAPLGFHFVSTEALNIKHYENALSCIAILLVICWASPNTQQLFSRYHPILEPINRPSPIHLKLGIGLGLVLGFIFFLILRNSYVSEPSPFIYFNF